jgi:hypothetical protein
MAFHVIVFGVLSVSFFCLPLWLHAARVVWWCGGGGIGSLHSLQVARCNPLIALFAQVVVAVVTRRGLDGYLFYRGEGRKREREVTFGGGIIKSPSRQGGRYRAFLSKDVDDHM